MKNTQRYKKRGWFGESHRHYLAAKGIKSKHDFKYFAKITLADPEEMKQRENIFVTEDKGVFSHPSFDTITIGEVGPEKGVPPIITSEKDLNEFIKSMEDRIGREEFKIGVSRAIGPRKMPTYGSNPYLDAVWNEEKFPTANELNRRELFDQTRAEVEQMKQGIIPNISSENTSLKDLKEKMELRDQLAR